MQILRRGMIALLVLAAGCGDDGEGRPGGAPPSATPVFTTTHAPAPTATESPSATPSPTASAIPTSTPTGISTPTPAPNPFGFSDDLLRVGAARLSIAPLPATAPGARSVVQAPVFETFTDFDFTLTCPDNPEVQLHFVPNALFDGVLTRPGGSEPFLDCGGTAGQFDAGIDVFHDLDGNGTFDGDNRNPLGLEPFDDANGNFTFDAIWMGGFDSARAAQGIDEAAPPMVTAMVISRSAEFVILVTLDTIGDVSTHLTPLRQRIAEELGLDGGSIDSPDVGRIIVSSLHNHEAADTIGVAGPTALSTEAVREVINSGLVRDLGPFAGVPVRSGINFTYRNWIDDQAVAAVKEAVRGLRAATLRSASAPAPTQSDAEILNPSPADQGESFRIPRQDQLLVTDIRWPVVRDPLVQAFQARDARSGEVIVTMLNWANHVEVLGSRNTLLSADYAGYVRQRLDATSPGSIGIFTVGAVGGLQTPLQNVFVPLLGESGALITDREEIPFAELYAPVLSGDRSAGELAGDLLATGHRAPEESAEKARSLGVLIAQVGELALAREEFGTPSRFRVSAGPVLVPLENPTLYLAAVLGVVEGREALYRGMANPQLVTDRPATCGLIGCLRETITLVELGDVRFVTAPGELLPEYVLGRPRPGVPQDRQIRFVQKDASGATVHDFGVNSFSAITALRTPGVRLFILGLGQGQLGYFIPQSDFVNVFEGTLPRPENLDAEVGFLADLNLTPILGLFNNPGFEATESLTVRQIVNAGWGKFPEDRYPSTALGGVSLTDVPGVSLSADHPNVIGNNNSLGPRVGHVVYNALCDLLDDGAANRSCTHPLPVADDPNAGGAP